MIGRVPVARTTVTGIDFVEMEVTRMLSAADFREILQDGEYDGGDGGRERQRARHDDPTGTSRAHCLSRWEDDGGSLMARDSRPDAALLTRRVSYRLDEMTVALVGAALPAALFHAAFTDMIATTFQVWRP